MSDALTAPACSEHVAVAAVASCTRCGRFVCETCVPVKASGLCVACEERAADSLPQRVWLIVALGCFAALVIPGLLALILGLAERSRISEGSAPVDGLPWIVLSERMVIAQWLALAVLAVSHFTGD